VGSNLERRLGRLRHGDHLCLIHESAAELLAALVPFVKRGLAAGDRCLWIGRSETSRELQDALEEQGVLVSRELDRGALVLLTERDAWLTGGRFDPGALLDLLRQVEQQALEDGFSGLRATWDLTWITAGTDAAEARLLEYEAELNRFLAGSRTLALCRYPRERTPPALIQSILRTHPLAVLGGQICPNSFYEPPEMAVGGGTPEERIDWMIAQVRRARVNEEKLEDLSYRLAQKGAALERADRAKEEFLAMLAHELRNPLGTISNAIQVLRMTGEGDETWKRAIDTAQRQVLHQAMLVDDLLEASRVTRGEIDLHCEQLDLRQLVAETVESYRETVRNAGLELGLELQDEPLSVRGDRMRLSQALTNLLDNATKFTAPGGHISVKVGRSAGGRRAEVSVRDDGIGIPADILPHIFEVFTQADDSLDRALGGLGVGLAVVRGLIEMHGGEVRARSEGEGKGAELSLLLPIEATAAAQAEARPAEETATSPAEARRILVVEDNEDAAATMRDFLELSGHRVALASSGADGVQAARQFHPEIVLCDLGLPGMTGYEVAAALRRDPATSSAKLIAVTGYGRDEDRRRSKEAGFDLHLTKPVDPAQLQRLLHEAARPVGGDSRSVPIRSPRSQSGPAERPA
jgi:signal transduction histidine kinase/ActR/RegA family two-component response regulator